MNLEANTSGNMDEEDYSAEERGEVAQPLIEIAARDFERSDADEAVLRKERLRKPDSFYSDLIFTLASIRYPEDEGKLVWINLLSHKAEMSRILERNVGIRVAALDFFRNVLGNLRDVKIIDSGEYLETAKLAVTDGLTGMFNHRYFQDRLQRRVELAHQEDAVISLLMLDIDYFKRFNDRFGHMAGDVALREVANTIKNIAGKGHTIARYGGEEFCIILPYLDRKEASEFAERVRLEVSKIVMPIDDVGDTGISVSVGVATLPEDATDRNGLIDQADLALYLAKISGRNRVVSSPIDQRRAERYSLSLSTKLRPSGKDSSEAIDCALIDMGEHGCGLSGRGLPASGAAIVVELCANNNDNLCITIDGRIAWKRTDPRVGELVGIEFSRLDTEVRSKLRSIIQQLEGV